MINRLLQDPMKAIFAAFLCITITWTGWASNRIQELTVEQAVLRQLVLDRLSAMDAKIDIIIELEKKHGK